jgi:osmoprotectant transport system permease protein
VRRRPARIAAGAALIAVGVSFATIARVGGGDSYVVGAKNFTEQFVLAALLSDRIRAEGGAVTQRPGLGSTVAFQALAAGEIDAYVDYSGTLWANVLHRTDNPPRSDLISELRVRLAERNGVRLLGTLGFENAYALAMRADRARELGVRTIADLAARARDLTIGADLEFFARPEWPALRDAYGLDFASRREFSPTFMYRAVADREVDVITAFSSDGRIAANDLVVLEDPRRAILSYDAIVLLAPSRANDALLARAFGPLLDAVPVELMREASLRVDRDADKEPPAAAARWLEERIH